ncbi:Peptidase inhibitor I9 [Lishizhenia tianjinensis]|uniref:Peptidase inhibitor I9 n=1 Tax=Lishizhenia tianjinensis TaxID=477690 RepID=A0A1I6XAB3_9FLAO|nr:S8 family peptidase [Lishizhenia tianjinensis]SFT35076.1 Peptidase inhibitor I9 [Lishizhenia tianjinensis]
MKRKLIYSVGFSAITLLAVSCKKEVTEQQAQREEIENVEAPTKFGEIIPNTYIVRYAQSSVATPKNNVSLTYHERQNLYKEELQHLHKSITQRDLEAQSIYDKTILGYSAVLSEEEVEKLKNDPRVINIEPDRIVSLGKPDGVGGGGNKGGDTPPPQTTPWGISRVNGGGSSSAFTAWIIDSGVDLDHPDLNVNTSLSETFLGGNSTPDDQNGHGTHVAGTVAALDNNFGVIGVAPGTSVVSVRVLDRRGSGSLSGVIAGVNYVASNAGANDVANMSLGGGISTSLDAAVISASSTCKFVLAAGNESDDANNHSPARVNGANIYTVSAMTSTDGWASFSNYGSPVDYIEPGVNINSTWKNGGYNTISGTSMAAPHLTGLLLLGNVSVGGYVNVTPDLPDTDPIGVH